MNFDVMSPSYSGDVVYGKMLTKGQQRIAKANPRPISQMSYNTPF